MATALTRPEAERQLAEAAARHREAVSSLTGQGRSPSAETAAMRAAARGVELVAYALLRAHAVGTPVGRLAEIAGWSSELVRQALERGPEPVLERVVASDVLDRATVTRSAETLGAMTRLDELLAKIASDASDPTWSPAREDLDELHERLEAEWRSWRVRLRPAG